MSEMTLVLGLAAAFAAAIVLATHLFRRVSVALLTIRARSWVSAVSRILSVTRDSGLGCSHVKGSDPIQPCHAAHEPLRKSVSAMSTLSRRARLTAGQFFSARTSVFHEYKCFGL